MCSLYAIRSPTGSDGPQTSLGFQKKARKELGSGRGRSSGSLGSGRSRRGAFDRNRNSATVIMTTMAAIATIAVAIATVAAAVAAVATVALAMAAAALAATVA